MKIPIRQILILTVMIAATAAIYKSRDALSPSDIDIMSGTNGALVYQEPFQKDVEKVLYTFEVDDAVLVPVALFDVSGVILGKKRYLPWRDYSFAPWDIGIGWRQMSDPSILDHVDFWQASRFMYFRYGKNAPVTKSDIIPNSTNIHVIPANDQVRKKISQIKEGNIVRLTGFLVNVIENGEVIKTSMTRMDTGAGACEILYVQDVDLKPL